MPTWTLIVIVALVLAWRLPPLWRKFAGRDRPFDG
jgi:hypothetical protein